MNPLIVKGVVFGLLLACAALWDMKEREIPNLIPAMILVCGLIISHGATPEKFSSATKWK